MSRKTLVRTNVRMWSPTVPLGPIAARVGLRTHIVYGKGDPMRTAKGVTTKRLSDEYYLSSTEVRANDLTAVRGQVAQFVRKLEADPQFSRQIEDRTIDVVVWAAIFGDQGAARIEDLNIEMTPFGRRIGLVVENYAEFGDDGNPRKLLVGPAASRKKAAGR